MKSPFLNDVFSLVWLAFKELFPDKDCNCYWCSDLIKEDNDSSAFAVTNFNSDGTVDVWVDVNNPVVCAADVFEHELAHVAVGYDAGHGEEWEKAVDEIHEKYEEFAAMRNSELLKEGGEE